MSVYAVAITGFIILINESKKTDSVSYNEKNTTINEVALDNTNEDCVFTDAPWIHELINEYNEEDNDLSENNIVEVDGRLVFLESSCILTENN